ncbi:unnamed protein product [Prorocentrum cordatum]|uniref:Uncharacterized protein n=1 Tax=Prorocentrum cordatum TaxID=2364126 RepID=A0ABN9RXJ4_9DINO|nr:unnamed protein product [Polarella glacialis]
MAAAGRVVQGSVVEGYAPRYVQATVVNPEQGGNAPYAQGNVPPMAQPYSSGPDCGAPTVIGTPIGGQPVGQPYGMRPQGMAYAPQAHPPMGMSSNPYSGSGYSGSGYGPGGGEAFDERADSPMCLAVLACLCCCPLVGICALVKSAEVSSANARGDYSLGHIKRKEAMMWIYMTVCLGMAFYIANVAMGNYQSKS